jgi:hypothetical protein
MRYDLELVSQLCREIGLSARAGEDQCVEVDLGHGAILCFQNAERVEDCLVGFPDIGWHFHDNLLFADAHGGIEFDYLDLLTGLKEGTVLICELEVDGRTRYRQLIHSEYNDEFKNLEAPPCSCCAPSRRHRRVRRTCAAHAPSRPLP